MLNVVKSGTFHLTHLLVGVYISKFFLRSQPRPQVIGHLAKIISSLNFDRGRSRI